jgi:DNA-binding CsgD family transcriptional regulator
MLFQCSCSGSGQSLSTATSAFQTFPARCSTHVYHSSIQAPRTFAGQIAFKQAIMTRGSELDIAVRASIVSLRFGAGLKAVDIAAILNIDPGTVRTTCHRMKSAANSEDLLELLKHCRTKKRSGRPSMKIANAVTGTKNPPATLDDKDNNQQPEQEHEAQLGTNASISPDSLAENFETTAWPERDLTAATAAGTNTTTHFQPIPPHEQYNIPLPSETLPFTTLDPQLSTPQPSDTQHPTQWPPRKT